MILYPIILRYINRLMGSSASGVGEIDQKAELRRLRLESQEMEQAAMRPKQAAGQPAKKK